MDHASDAHLIDAIKASFGLSTDSEVAAFLGITRSAIYRVRQGKSRLGPWQRLKVLDRLGRCAIGSLVERISVASLTNRLRRARSQKAKPIATATARRRLAYGADGELLEEFKAVFGFETDVELADFLGLKSQTLSTVRTGRSTLGTGPRLKILNRLEPFELADVEAVLASTDTLIRLLTDGRFPPR